MPFTKRATAYALTAFALSMALGYGEYKLSTRGGIMSEAKKGADKEPEFIGSDMLYAGYTKEELLHLWKQNEEYAKNVHVWDRDEPAPIEPRPIHLKP